MYTNTRNAYIEIYFPYMWRIESKHNHYSYCASLLLHQILFIFAVHVVIVVFVSFSAFVRSSVLDVRSLLCCSFFASTLFVVSLSLFLLPSVYAFFLFTRLFGLFFTLNLLYKVVRCIHCARFFLQHFFFVFSVFRLFDNLEACCVFISINFLWLWLHMYAYISFRRICLCMSYLITYHFRLCLHRCWMLSNSQIVKDHI